MKTRGWIALFVGLAGMIGMLVVLWYGIGRPREQHGDVPGSGTAGRPTVRDIESGRGANVADAKDDPVLSAMSVLNDKRLRNGNDPTVVEAIGVLRRRKDARALPALVAGITFCAPGDGIPGPASGNQRHPCKSYPAVPAIIEFHEAAVPPIISALAEGVEPDSQREHFLLTCLGAILGPHKGVKHLEDAIAKAQTPEKQENLRAALRAFREFTLVGRWLPEGEDQPFEGNIYEELKSKKGSTP